MKREPFRERQMAGLMSAEGGHGSLPIIRRLKRVELGRLQSLWLDLYRHHTGLSPRLAGLEPESFDKSWRRQRARYENWLRDRNAFVLVAEVSHELIGYAFVVVNESFTLWGNGERMAELQTLSVAPTWRDRGIGTQLLVAVRRILSTRRIQCLVLSALVSNTDAHRFYERLGFSKTEVFFVSQITNGLEGTITTKSSIENKVGTVVDHVGSREA